MSHEQSMSKTGAERSDGVPVPAEARSAGAGAGRRHEAERPMQIAVVGLSSLFPGSSDVDGFFQDILAGRDRITKVPRTHWLIEDYYDPDPRAPD